MVPGTGDAFAGLRIGEVLGSGASAVVYRATRADGSTCALKVVAHPDEARRQRVLRELLILRTLDHPNVVHLLDSGETPDAVWLALELVEGPTLEALLAGYTPNDDQVDELARGLLAGVAAAHAAGIVHRDLKPANVLLQVSGERLIPRVVDFGVARPLADDGPRPTRSGATLGTPAYMAPEQFRTAKAADARADVYALGAILYELVTGARPFAGDDVVALYDAKRRGDVCPVEVQRANTPAGWAVVITRAMAPDPAARYADAAGLLAAWNRGPLWAERHRTALTPRTSGSDTRTADVPRAAILPLSTRPMALGAAAAAGLATGLALAAGLAGALALLSYGGPAPVAAAEPRVPAPVAEAPPAPSTAAAPAVPAPAVARVAPAVVAAKPTPPTPVAPAAVCRLDVEGAPATLLTTDGRELPPGDVPPGTYTVRLVGDPDVGVVVTVAAGETRVVRCEPRLRSCR